MYGSVGAARELLLSTGMLRLALTGLVALWLASLVRWARVRPLRVAVSSRKRVATRRAA